MADYGYIYKTTNLKEGKVYIGQNKGELEPSYYGSGIYLKSAIKKHGKQNFKLEVVCYLPTKEHLDEFEKFLIDKYREILGQDKLYNIADGGRGGRSGTHSKECNCCACKEHEEGCACGSCKMKRSEYSGENNPMYGKKRSQETKESISRKLIEYYKKTGNHPRLGKHLSKESKIKMSISAKNKPPISEETRIKIGIASKKSWENRRRNNNVCKCA